MTTLKTKGQCIYCKKEYAQTGITRHIQACKERQAAHEKESAKAKTLIPIYHLRIQGTYNPVFWLNVELAGTANLLDLDRFLRDIWVECCGHLSQFNINQTHYMSHPYDMNKNMKHALKDVLAPDAKFSYEYDFGSTTYLDLRVAEVRQGQIKKGAVNILARNNPLIVPCSVCGEPTTQLCPECMWDGEAECEFCDACAKKHPHYADYDGLMPFVNSPRVGVCGYGYE